MPAKKSIDDLLNEYDITEEWLRDAYAVRELSLPKIRNEKNIGFKTTQRLLRHFNIPIRSISESRKTTTHQREYKQLLNDKYGVDNISQIPEVKKKKEQTFLKNYGVDNIWKSKAYCKWLDSYMLKRYGSKRTGFCLWDTEQHSKKSKRQWRRLTKEEKEEKIKQQLLNLHRSSTKNNRIECFVANRLDDLQLSYHRGFRIGRYVADFYISPFNLIIECNGDFWHANPNKYNADDILRWPGSNGITAKEIWNKDSKKLDFYKNRGYDVFIVWEHDIKSNPASATIDILNEIKKYKED